LSVRLHGNGTLIDYHATALEQEDAMADVRHATNGDTRIAYETFGDPAAGDPLLLVMGLDFQMIWWPDAFCEALVAAGFCVTRFDNRDTGLSTKFTSPQRQNPFKALLGGVQPAYTSLDMVDDALAVMDAVGWRSAHVVGGSMGAALAQLTALTHPERVRSLVSIMGLPVDTPGWRTMSYLRFGIFRQLFRIAPGTDHAGRTDALVAIYRAMFGPGYPFPEEWARQTAALADERSPRDETSTQRQLAAGRAVTAPPLSGLRVPTLVMHGEDDPLVKVAGGRATAARVPDALLVTYPGMGHAMPAELWSDIVTRIRANADRATGKPI
jgi:pimeloyl-ACP methyl ester carboxylesterase